MMVNWQEYKNVFQPVGLKYNKYSDFHWINWFMQYEYYERNWWDYYFNNIFLRYCDISANIQLYFWESCPGGMPFPHPNYVFDRNHSLEVISNYSGRYLIKIANKNKMNWENKNYIDLLSELSKIGILIVDIYPCHGISLKSKQRKNYLKILYPSYSMNKLHRIDSEIKRLKNGVIPIYSNTIYCSSEIFRAGLDNSNLTFNSTTEVILRLTSSQLNFDKI